MKNKELVELLIKKNYKISFAESCTGGMLASLIVDIADASKVLNESFVTYSNEAKHNLLNVKFETIDKYNVVSEEVCKEMVIGLFNRTNADICVSVSGVAGPTGGTDEIPVGTVCFGFKIKENIITKRIEFGNLGRNEVRMKACEYVFDFLIQNII